MNKEKKIIFKNIVVSSVGQIFTFVILFFVNILIIRYLGPKHYGLFAYLFSIFTITWQFIEAGFSPAMIKEINITSCSIDKIFSRFLTSVFVVSIICTIIFLIFCILSYFFIKKIFLIKSGLILSFAIINMCIATCMSAVIRAMEKMEYTAFGALFHKCILLLLIFVTIQIDTGIIGIVWSYVIASFLFEVYYFILLNLKFNINFSFSFNIKDILNTTKKAFPLGIGMLSRRMSLQTEIILLNLMQLPSSAGIFAAVFKLYQPLQQMAQIIAVTFLPFLNRHQKMQSKYKIFISKVFFCSFLISMAIYFFIPFLKPILGPKYDFSISSYTFKILLIAIPSFFSIPFVFCILLAKNKEYLWLRGNIITLIFNLILSTCLIYFFNLQGAVISRVIVEWFLISILLFFL